MRFLEYIPLMYDAIFIQRKLKPLQKLHLKQMYRSYDKLWYEIPAMHQKLNVLLAQNNSTINIILCLETEHQSMLKLVKISV